MKAIAAAFFLLATTQASAQSDCKVCVKEQSRAGNYYSCRLVTSGHYYVEKKYYYCSDGEEYKDERGNISRECATFSECTTPIALRNGRKMFYVSTQWSCPHGVEYANRQLFT